MTIRDILTRPLPPPKRTVGTVALAIALSVTGNVLQAQQTKRHNTELATLRRDVRRLRKLSNHAVDRAVIAMDAAGTAMTAVDNANLSGVVVSRRLDTLIAELRAQDKLTVPGNTEVPTTQTVRRTRPPGEH